MGVEYRLIKHFRTE